MAEKKDDCVESPISPCTVEEKAGDGNEEVSPCLDEVSSSSSSSSRDNIPEFAYPASWEAVGLESPLGEESAEEEAEALEEQEEDHPKEADDEVDDIQLDLYFHQMELFAAEQEEVQEAASSAEGQRCQFLMMALCLRQAQCQLPLLLLTRTRFQIRNGLQKTGRFGEMFWSIQGPTKDRRGGLKCLGGLNI